VSYEFEDGVSTARVVRVVVATARGVAARWFDQNFVRHGNNWYSSDRKVTHAQLLALGDNPPIDKAAEVIGNKSWTYILCKGCSEYVERAVKIGDGYDPEIVLCQACLDEGARAIANPPEKKL